VDDIYRKDMQWIMLHVQEWWYKRYSEPPCLSSLTNMDRDSLQVFSVYTIHSTIIHVQLPFIFQYFIPSEFNQNYMNFLSVDWIQHNRIVAIFLFLPPWRWPHKWPKHVDGHCIIKLHSYTQVHLLVCSQTVYTWSMLGTWNT
jgi:lambda repressor-like predicted transcriptional regulator